ncbi:MAG: NAD(P)-binding protein [Woeseiaceae bacterium]|nr:NAD(P)-binding protein [Woeseiaceae bacterium]
MGRNKHSKITRRDFVNGVAMGAAGLALTPVEAVARGILSPSALGPEYYPPILTGIRGSHPGSFEIAHTVALAGQRFSPPSEQTDSTYDLVVVGGGISGLSAAKFFRDRHDGLCRILVLDNHDDFGGHARRNEFDVDGKMLLCYGGSQTIQDPSRYSKVAKGLLKDIAIEPDRFYDYYDQEYFSSRNLQHGIYFDDRTYGVDRLTPNPIASFFGTLESDDEKRAAVRAMPIPRADQDEFYRLVTSDVDYLDGQSIDDKRNILRNTSYLDFLKNYAGMPEAVLEILRDSFLQLTSVGWEAASALYAAEWYFPGTLALGVQKEDDGGDPYIHHFPDGNAGVARSLVRDLVPDAIPGSTMEDLVTARADYSLLDTDDADIRIRLNSTAVDVRHTRDGKHVDVTYTIGGKVCRVRARHTVMACYNAIIPHICSEVPEKQVEAIRYGAKIPFVKASIVLRSWHAFINSGYFSLYSPGDVYFKHLKLDFPVSMGDYEYPQGPDEPIVVSGWYSPATRGLPAKEQYKAGQRRLLAMRYDDFEQNIYSHLDGMLGSHGFEVEKEIAAITLNRWPHGYAYEFEGIGEPAEYDRYNGPHIAGRAQIGRISIANSDSEAYAYVNGAIDAADRAVNEQLRYA